MFLIPVNMEEGFKMMVLSVNFIGSSEFYSLEDGKKNDKKEIRKPFGYNVTKKQEEKKRKRTKKLKNVRMKLKFMKNISAKLLKADKE